MLQTFADIQTFAESKTYVLNSVKDLDYEFETFAELKILSLESIQIVQAIQDFLLFNNHKNLC